MTDSGLLIGLVYIASTIGRPFVLIDHYYLTVILGIAAGDPDTTKEASGLRPFSFIKDFN